MANRRTTPKELPDAVRETLDEFMKSAEAGAGAVRERVRGALEDLEERRPATQEDVSELRKELKAINKRLDAIEARLPAAKRSGSARAASKPKAKPRPKSNNRQAKVAAARSAAKRSR